MPERVPRWRSTPAGPSTAPTRRPMTEHTPAAPSPGAAEAGAASHG